MKRRGFTIVELLITIVIMALLGGIGVISFRSIFGTGEEIYYESVESNVLLAGNDYFLDHREELPIADHVSEVSLATLVDTKYLEPVKKSDGTACTQGKVFVYNENDKYRYEVCLECDDNYVSKGKYCNGAAANEIVVSAKKAVSKISYNASLSYDDVEYSKENIEINVSMKNVNTTVTEYEVMNTKTGVQVPCNKTGNACLGEISVSGTYQIKAKNGNDVLATKYINVKINRNGPNFTVTGDDITPLTCTGSGTTKDVTFKIIKDNVNEEYKSIKYDIYRKVYNTTTGQQELTKVKSGTEANLTRGNNGKEYYINETGLSSGRYELRVTITNFANESVTNSPVYEFDISYYANVEFDDNNYAGLEKTHEVVYGQKYDYKKALPREKDAYELQNVTIRWHLNNVAITGDTIVTNTCTHTIVGKMSIPVPIEDFSKYCKNNVTYTGNPQDLTEAEPEPNKVTFVNKSQTNVNTQTLYAHVNSPQYVWSDGTTTDQPFECEMSPKEVTITAENKSMTYSGSEPTYTYAITGVVNNDTAIIGTASYAIKSGNTTISNVSAANVGSYTIVPSGLTAASSNYTIKYVNGTLTINKKSLTCPNSTVPVVDYTGSPVQSGVSCPTGSTTGGTTSGTNVGEYTQTCTANDNYSFASSCSITWRIEKVGYTIKYNLNGASGSIADTKCESGSNCNITSTVPEWNINVFEGWSTSNGTKIVYEKATEVTVTHKKGEDSTQIAQYTNVMEPVKNTNYGLEIDLKGNGEGLFVNYLYGTNNPNYLNATYTYNSNGKLEDRTSNYDGYNFTVLTSSWKHYSVEYRFPNVNKSSEGKHLLFGLRPRDGHSETPTASIKNVKLYRKTGHESIYAKSATVKDIAAAGETITLYAVWKQCYFYIHYGCEKPNGSTTQSINDYVGNYSTKDACLSAVASGTVCPSGYTQTFADCQSKCTYG